MFREDKATAMAVFFLRKAGGVLNDIKLMKLLYLAERESLRIKNSTIAGDSFVIMKNGQVLSDTLRRMSPHVERGNDVATIWREHISPCVAYKEMNIGLKVGETMDLHYYLSELDLSTLEKIWDDFGGMGKWPLRDLCHRLPECKETLRRERLSEDDIVKQFGLDEESLAERINDLRYSRHIDSLFGHNS
jgi:uncharacterized phage-associated protein